MIKSKIWPRTCFTNQLSVSLTKMKILCIYLIKKKPLSTAVFLNLCVARDIQGCRKTFSKTLVF